MTSIRILAAAAAVVILASTASAASAMDGEARPAVQARAADVSPPPALPARSDVLSTAERVADYYRATYPYTTVLPANGWSWSTYFQGVMALYGQTGEQRYLSDGLAWGRSNDWQLTTLEADPDSMKAGQTYFDLHALDATADLTAMDSAMAGDLSSLPVTQYDWIDALFMGLPNWTRWYGRTADAAYLTKLDSLYRWARDSGATSGRCANASPPQPGLFDAHESLWYRDCRFVGAVDVNGKPVFWARGNGWVIAAMAQVAETLPPGSARRAKYAAMLATMARRLVKLQRSNGFWRPSLLDPSLYPEPETSGTALITYALANGIRTGILDATTYLPVVDRAWQGLTSYAAQTTGFVRGCQPPGAAPGPTYTATAPRVAPSPTSAGTVNSDSPPYCVGAFVLAASEVAQIAG